jgi:hypothetical protein
MLASGMPPRRRVGLAIIPSNKLASGKIEHRRQNINSVLTMGGTLAGSQEMAVNEGRISERETADVKMNGGRCRMEDIALTLE